MTSRAPALYRDPGLYDLIHHDGTDDEVWLLDRLSKIHGCGVKTALEPGCGTGRYLAGLLRRGWAVEGYDVSRVMTAYARKRLSAWGSRAEVSLADMTSYRPARRFGLIFNLLSTFRHLMSDRQALAHLRLMSGALEPGGIFVLGMDLALYGGEEPEEEVWKCRRGRNRATHVVMSLPASALERRERIINFVTTPAGRHERVLESSYDLRSYDAAQAAGLIARSPLRLVQAYGYDGKPASLDGPERALWLVLKNR
ncbi:MAG: class I SAM-dependent methyltransferase [Elusimicrobiota bacterium]